MTREEILQGAEIMKAYVEGKQLQYKYYTFDAWTDCDNTQFNFELFQYRIKPKEPTYRPYKDCEEMIADYRDKYSPIVRQDQYKLYMDNIWLRNKDNNGVVQIIGFLDDYVHFCNSFGYCDLEHLFKKFTYLDGSPVGKLEE